MKVLFLEPDRVLADNIDIFMNRLRLKMSMKKYKKRRMFSKKVLIF